MKEVLPMDQNVSSENRWLDLDAFRRNLRALIDDKGLSGKEVAEAIQSTPPTISRYFTKDREPSIEILYRLSRYFGCTIDWLLGLSDSRFDSLTPKVREMAELYARASSSDQLVIETLLSKYKK